MTDAEVICSFMEPRPKWVAQVEPHEWTHRWWNWYTDKDHHHLPIVVTLDRLHEVEARLSERQRGAYRAAFRQVVEKPDGSHPKHLWVWAALHAAAEQKIRALATVLRGLPLTEPATKAEGSTSPGECECCGAVATKADVEGVPLCDDCYEDLKCETNAILHPDVGGGDQEPQ